MVFPYVCRVDQRTLDVLARESLSVWVKPGEPVCYQDPSVQLTPLSDFIATTVRSTFTYSDYAIGAWAANVKDGVRHYPHSTVFVNLSTYETLNEPELFGFHVLGEVSVEMVWVIQQPFMVCRAQSSVPNADGTLTPYNIYRLQTLNPLELLDHRILLFPSMAPHYRYNS